MLQAKQLRLLANKHLVYYELWGKKYKHLSILLAFNNYKTIATYS